MIEIHNLSTAEWYLQLNSFQNLDSWSSRHKTKLLNIQPNKNNTWIFHNILKDYTPFDKFDVYHS